MIIFFVDSYYLYQGAKSTVLAEWYKQKRAALKGEALQSVRRPIINGRDRHCNQGGMRVNILTVGDIE